MKCPYFHTEFVDNEIRHKCLLFQLRDITWNMDCKKCITNDEARKRAWEVDEHHIKDALFARIPKEFHESFEECPYHGDKLEGIFKEEKCCGGKKTKEVQLYECTRDDKPVSQKDCLLCLQLQRSDL